MRRIFFSLWNVLLVLSLGCAIGSAQATAQISGTAKDQSGAVLPGVEITVTQTETGIARNIVTNETGSYVLTNLALGPYRLEAGLPGFRTYVQSGIVLQVNSSPVINVVMEVGQVSEQVEVQANAALVETRNSTVGAVIENERILELPLNGRNVTDLITLAGGSVKGGDVGDRMIAGAPMMSVAGSAGFSTDYTLDGANHLSFMSGTTLLMPFPDAMQEFKVETSGVTAQKGSATAVSAVTKSGTNELHGNLFEFVRNDLFNARNYFATRGSTLKRNQFGGTLGGPVVKNKLFFFGGYQGTTIRSDPADTRAFVPTAAMMAGDWTAFASPACNAGRQLNLRAPFVNNRIDPALYAKTSMYILTVNKPLALPTAENPCGEVTYGNRAATNEPSYVGKVDYQKSAQHSLFGRVFFFSRDNLNPWKSITNLLQATGWISSLQSSYTFGSTYLLGSNTVHSFRLAANRAAVHYYNSGTGESPRLFNWCDAGSKIYCEPEITRIQNMNINGGFNLGSGFLTKHKYVGNTFTLNDDLSLIRGSHQMAFGLNATHGRQSSYSNWASVTQTNYNGGITGSGLGDFVLGRVASIQFAKSNAHHANGTTFALYGTDTWKATPRLTLNYGLRWEPFIPQWVEYTYNFDYDRFKQGIKSSVYVNAPAGFYYRGDPGFPDRAVNSRWLQFSPRMGFAWDVSGDGRTSIRASYALGYVYVPGDFKEGYSGSPPFANRVKLSSPPGGMDDPWRDIPGGNIFPFELDKNVPFPGYGIFYSQRYDFKNPYNQSWNLSIQRQVGTGWLATASYLGSNTMHLWGNKQINPAVYFPGGPCTINGVSYNPCSTLDNTDARRRLSLERAADGAKIGFLTEGDDGGIQVYHGMLLSLERRAAKGVTVTGNYTYSHCIGPYATEFSALAQNQSDTYNNPTGRDRGNCDSDRRQMLNLTSVAETPKFSNRTLRLVASEWRLSGLFTRTSGTPLSIFAGSDRALNGVGFNASATSTQRADQVLGEPYGEGSGPLQRFLNPAAFALPALGTIGNVARNSVQGPTQWTFDVALSRAFRFRETKRVEFRAEAFNLTNSFRGKDPNTAVNNANFGVIRTAFDPRILQFALKYFF